MRLSGIPFWVWPVAGIAIILLVTGVSWLPRYTTSNPDFCLSCHSTGETPDRSPQSLVHPTYDMVSCTDCHAKPGPIPILDGYQDGYSADPERVNDNCRRCHGGIADKKEVEFEHNEYDIRIPHKFHLEVVGAQCTDCHRNIAHEMISPATNRPHMDYCFQCHTTPQSRTCTKCHVEGIPSPSTPPLAQGGGVDSS
jgi:nitrate/TMAO reductase-like tetraheme cytochrome c subunit